MFLKRKKRKEKQNFHHEHYNSTKKSSNSAEADPVAGIKVLGKVKAETAHCLTCIFLLDQDAFNAQMPAIPGQDTKTYYGCA